MSREPEAPKTGAPATEPAKAAVYRRPSGAALADQWNRLVTRCTSLLRDPQPETFIETIDELDAQLLPLIANDGDRTLLTALFLAGSSPERYCAAHSMHVAIGCHLAAGVLGEWDAARLALLRRAALTMNIGMATLQDQLARQASALSPDQRGVIDAHAEHGVQILRELKVSDEDWLGAVGRHHSVGAGASDGGAAAEQMARLIQRVDRLTASLSARGYQETLGAAAAARSIYKDENDMPDPYGAAVIKALGIYPPGSLVRLANKEVAIVLRRGERADQPLVAAVVRDSGMPYLKPKVLRTSEPGMAITEALTQAKLNVRLALSALLDLGP